MTDDRRWPDVAPDDVEQRQSEDLQDGAVAGEDRDEDMPEGFQDVPEPLEGEDSDSSLGGTTDPEASRNRRDGLEQDENGTTGTPNSRKG